MNSETVASLAGIIAARKDIYVKNQQRGEPDLTENERRVILTKVRPAQSFSPTLPSVRRKAPGYNLAQGLVFFADIGNQPSSVSRYDWLSATAATTPVITVLSPWALMLKS